MVRKNTKYQEIANQKNQIAMLFARRTDLIVLDRKIFKYHRSRLKNVDTNQAVTFHEIFEPSSFKIAFSNEKIRDIFNSGLSELRESGKYDKIIESYIEN